MLYVNRVETLEDAKSVAKSIIYDNLQLRLESNGVINVLTSNVVNRGGSSTAKLVELEGGRIRFTTTMSETHLANYVLEHMDIVNALSDKWSSARYRVRKNYEVLNDVLSQGDINIILHFISVNDVCMLFVLGGKRVFISKKGDYDYEVLFEDSQVRIMPYFDLLGWLTDYREDVLDSVNKHVTYLRTTSKSPYSPLSPFKLNKVIASRDVNLLAKYVIDNNLAIDYSTSYSKLVIIPLKGKEKELVKYFYIEGKTYPLRTNTALLRTCISMLRNMGMPLSLGWKNFKNVNDYIEMTTLEDKRLSGSADITPLVKSRGGGAKDGEFRLMYANDLNNSIGMAGFPTGLKYKNATLCLGDVITFLDSSGREQTGIIHMKRNLITVSTSGDIPLSQVGVLGVVSRWKDAGNVLDVNGQRILFEPLIR